MFHYILKVPNISLRTEHRDERLDTCCCGTEKEAVSDEDEELLWRSGLLKQSKAKSMVNSIYLYNGKIFGLRGGEHWN